MSAVSEGNFVRLKRSSQWPKEYVPLEQKPVKVLEIISLREVSNKPLVTAENTKMAVLDAVVDNAIVHHNGKVVVHLEDVRKVSFFERITGRIRMRA